MFRPVAMKRLSAVVLEQDERAVLSQLGQLGAMHLTRTPAGPDSAPLAPRDRSEELARCDRLLNRAEALRQALEIQVSDGKLEPSGWTLAQAEENLLLLEKQSAETLRHRQGLMQRHAEVNAVCERVLAYRGLEIPLDELDGFSYLHFVAGSLPAKNFGVLQQGIGDHVALLPLPEKEGWLPLIAMTTRADRTALETALQQQGFQRETLPVVEGATTDTLCEAGAREREQVAAELGRLNAELKAHARAAAGPLSKIEQSAATERRLLEAEQTFPRTEAAVLITGWVPADAQTSLEQRLQKITNGRCVTRASVPEKLPSTPVPVLLRHPRLLRPFEMLVSAYGLPEYQELEPTLFVALSYVLMFGMMFGDAGHGAVLATCGLIAWFVGRTEKVRDVGLLVLFAGTSSVIFGCVYGSFFGLEQFKQYALWHDPLEGDPMGLMYAAIGIGIVLISLGLILNVINRFRRGDLIGGFLDKYGVVGVLFYWGVLALITKFAAIQSRGLVNLAVVLFLVVPLAGWALKEPIEYFVHRHAGFRPEADGGLFAAITESFVGAFEAVLSYLANTISFVRLAAYAMSHAALLVAAFMMAEEVSQVSIGGGALSLIVVILGNLIAIVLEGIIASVQALRLEYYEFFGKFFSGTGQPFRPFRLALHEQAPA